MILLCLCYSSKQFTTNISLQQDGEFKWICAGNLQNGMKYKKKEIQWKLKYIF